MDVEPNLLSLIILFNCSLCSNSTSESKSNTVDRIFPVLPLLISELFTFNINRLLNDDAYEAEEILGVVLERNVIPKVQNNVETVLLSLPDVFIQTSG